MNLMSISVDYRFIYLLSLIDLSNYACYFIYNHIFTTCTQWTETYLYGHYFFDYQRRCITICFLNTDVNRKIGYHISNPQTPTPYEDYCKERSWNLNSFFANIFVFKKHLVIHQTPRNIRTKENLWYLKKWNSKTLLTKTILFKPLFNLIVNSDRLYQNFIMPHSSTSTKFTNDNLGIIIISKKLRLHNRGSYGITHRL